MILVSDGRVLKADLNYKRRLMLAFSTYENTKAG